MGLLYLYLNFLEPSGPLQSCNWTAFQPWSFLKPWTLEHPDAVFLPAAVQNIRTLCFFPQQYRTSPHILLATFPPQQTHNKSTTHNLSFICQAVSTRSHRFSPSPHPYTRWATGGCEFLFSRAKIDDEKTKGVKLGSRKRKGVRVGFQISTPFSSASGWILIA